MSEIDTSDVRVDYVAMLIKSTPCSAHERQQISDLLRALLRERNEARWGRDRLREEITALHNTMRSPDIAAILRGEAVAVPVKITSAMEVAALLAEYGDGVPEDEAAGRYTAVYRAMLAASPYAKEAGQ